MTCFSMSLHKMFFQWNSQIHFRFFMGIFAFVLSLESFSSPVLCTCFGTKNHVVIDFTTKFKVVHNQKWVLNQFWVDVYL
jgi:hypothetical protein